MFRSLMTIIREIYLYLTKLTFLIILLSVITEI